MDKIERRGPEEGYDNEPKMKYRHEVWSRLSEKALPILENNDNAKVLMLPSKEGIEIDIAMEYGIKAHQIICIDENPALLAHAKWKHKIPKENRFGCKVSKIGKKITDRGWMLAAANLDFCNNFSGELIDESKAFFNNTPFIDAFYFSITLMRGRETKAVYQLLDNISASYGIKERRLRAYCSLIENDNLKVASSIFTSKYYVTSPMVYGIFEVAKTYGYSFYSKEDIDKIFNDISVLDAKKSAEIWSKHRQRIDKYLRFTNSIAKFTKKRDCFVDDWHDIFTKEIEDKKTFYDIPEGVYNCGYIYLNHIGREQIIKNIKRWFKGNLSARGCLELFFYIDEGLDLDLGYMLYGIPNKFDGHDTNKIYDTNYMVDIGTRNLAKKTDLNIKTINDAFWWGVLEHGDTDLAYF